MADKTIQDRLNKDVQTYRLITVAVLVDRLKINGSLARKALADLEEKGVIKKVVGHSKLSIYSKFPSSSVEGMNWRGKRGEGKEAVRKCERTRVGIGRDVLTMMIIARAVAAAE